MTANQPPWYNSRLMRAVRREPTDCVPVWLMRQAGRYLPEYRRIRSRFSFWQLCRNPQLCAELMVQTVEKLGVDAAIVFSDLLTVLDALGLEVKFQDGGPRITKPIRTSSDIARLKPEDDLGRLEYVFQAVSQTRRMLDDRLPLIGFAGAPFTLASYAIEGGTSRSFVHTKRLMYCDPEGWQQLLELLGDCIVRYAVAQAKAGAQVLQLFDSWAGCLSPDDYRHYVLPETARCLDKIRGVIPVIYFTTGNPALLPLFAELPADVIGVDWRVDLHTAWQKVGLNKAIQGNLDPAVLLAPQDVIRRKVKQILNQTRGRPGHVFNLGHGVLPQTPVDNAIALVRFVHELSSATATDD